MCVRKPSVLVSNPNQALFLDLLSLDPLKQSGYPQEYRSNSSQLTHQLARAIVHESIQILQAIPSMPVSSLVAAAGAAPFVVGAASLLPAGVVVK